MPQTLLVFFVMDEECSYLKCFSVLQLITNKRHYTLQFHYFSDRLIYIYIFHISVNIYKYLCISPLPDAPNKLEHFIFKALEVNGLNQTLLYSKPCCSLSILKSNFLRTKILKRVHISLNVC